MQYMHSKKWEVYVCVHFSVHNAFSRQYTRVDSTLTFSNGFRSSDLVTCDEQKSTAYCCQ